MHWKQTLTNIIDSLFPQRTDAAFIAKYSHTALLEYVQPTYIGEAAALLPYQNPLVRACIHELKYHRNSQAIHMLSAVLDTYMRQQTKNYVVLPIPLSKQRKRSRGYNQIELLTEKMTHLKNITIVTDVLLRVVDTTPQTTLARKERLTNVHGAFVLAKDRTQHITNQHILLLDDVTTTGATLSAAKAALSPHCPASITCLALAH